MRVLFITITHNRRLLGMNEVQEREGMRMK